MKKIIALFLLCLLAACTQPQTTTAASDADCYAIFSNVRSRILTMLDNGQLENAQNKLDSYQTCYSNNSDYWLLRAVAITTKKDGKEPSPSESRLAADYMAKAIKINPDNGFYRVGNSTYLIGAGDYEAGMESFEKGVDSGLDPTVTGRDRVKLRSTILDVAPFYVHEAQTHGDITRAKKHLSPYLSAVCTTFPEHYKQHYAQPIIWMVQQFNGGGPAPHTDAAAVSKALESSCAEGL